MADRTLRERERRGARSPTDQALLLREQVRAGRLELGRVELAAWCQDPVAALCMGWRRVERRGGSRRHLKWSCCDCPGGSHPFECPSRLDLIARWVNGLARWGDEAVLRAAIAAAHAVVGPRPECTCMLICVGQCDPGLFVRVALRAAEGFVVRPSGKARSLWASCCARLTGPAIEYCPAPYGGVERLIVNVVAADRLLDRRLLREQIRDDLVPWALGVRDPLAERVKEFVVPQTREDQ